jgi:hypothetical protein
MWGMGIKGRINVAFLLIGIRSVFGIAYRLIEHLRHIEKPEGIDDPVMPEQEFDITLKLRTIHFLKMLEIHLPLLFI